MITCCIGEGWLGVVDVHEWLLGFEGTMSVAGYEFGQLNGLLV